MKPTTWFLAGLMLLFLAGCSAASAEQGINQGTAKNEAKAADVDESSAEQNAAPAEFTPPFPGNQDFFTPPQLDVPHLAGLTTGADGRVQVRVLGFVKVEGGTDRVIVQVGDLTDVVEPGHVIQGVEVISLQEPSVTLQLNGARWNVGMFDQQAMTAVASVSRPAGRSTSARHTTPQFSPKLPPLPSMGHIPHLPMPPSIPGVPLPPGR